MKSFLEEYKMTFMILGGLLVILAIIIVPTVIISVKNEKKEYFPTYDDVVIKKDDFIDKKSDNYLTVKKQLEKDEYFAREALISNYYYRNYTSADLQNMVWNFIFSYELNNTRNLSSIDYKDGKFCMRSKYVIDAFEELYNIKITTDMELLPGYFEYISVNGEKYCFNFGNVARDYDNQIKVAVEDLSIDDDKIITANIYVYEYYTSGNNNEKAYIKNLQINIDNSDYSAASKIVEDILGGKVTHKQLNFRIHNNGNYFKYQILQSKYLVY